MHKLISILVVADRSSADQVLLEKAVLLARRVGAQIHLFSCDAQLAHTLRHSGDPKEAEKAWNAGVADRRAYLESLRTAVGAPDLYLLVEATCDGPLCDVISKKALECNADLVMKSPSGAHPLRGLAFDTNDWQLMRTCPVTMMLVRERPWHEPPRFAALVDVGDTQGERLAETIVHTSEYFALGCQGSLELVYSDPADDGALRRRHTAALERLAREYHIGEANLHVLAGDPHNTLTELVARRAYDVVMLGALTHRRGFAALIGTLTSQLMDGVRSDLVLVKRELAERLCWKDSTVLTEEDSSGDVRKAPGARTPHRGRGQSRTGVLWQAIFGD